MTGSKQYRRIATVAAVSAAYCVSANIGLSLATQPAQVTAIWPPAGVAIAALVLCGNWVWPAIAIGAFVANVFTHEPILTAAFIALGNTLEGLAGAWLLRNSFKPQLTRLNDVIRLVIVAPVSAIIAATMGTATLALSGLAEPADAPYVWHLWWLGDSMGIYVVAPLLLTWFSRKEEHVEYRPVELLALLAAVAALVVFCFSLPYEYALQIKFIIFPLMVWAGYRFGQRITSAAIVLTSLIAILALLHNPQGMHNQNRNALLLLIQGFVAVLAITSLILGALASERRSAQKALQSSHDQLKDHVRELSRATEEMRRGEQRLQAIIDNSTAIIHMKDTQGRYMLVNREWELANQLKREAVIGRMARDIYPANTVDALSANDQRVLESKSAIQVEETVNHSSGTRTYLTNKFPLIDGSGACFAICGISADITKRKAEERAVALRYTVAKVLARNPEAHLAVGEVLKAISLTFHLHAGAVWLFDSARQQLTNFNFYCDETYPCKEYIESTRRTFELGEGILGVVARSGETQWIVDLGADPGFIRAPATRADGLKTGLFVPIKTQDRILGVIEFFSRTELSPQADLTQLLLTLGKQVGDFIERKHIEESIKEGDARKSAILDSALDCIIGLDSHGSITEWNPAAEQTFQYTKAEALGVEMAKLIIPENLREQHRRGLERYCTTGESRILNRRIELTAIRKDGVEFPVEVTITRVPYGIEPVFMGYLRDITERKRIQELEHRAKEQAETANRAKDEFLAVVSHELRTPLTAILGWTRLLRMNPEDTAQQAHGLEVIERNVRAQVRLVEDLLDISRVISGKLRLNMQPINLTSVIHAAVDTVSGAAKAKGITLRQLSSFNGTISGDPDRVQQVVWNLLTNAIKFTPTGGSISLELQASGDEVSLIVTDTGQGIAPEFLPRMFSRFSQADSSTTRQHGGLGLGLAIVKNIVELHGGSIRAESEGKDKGARFVVTFPIAKTQAEPRTETPPASRTPSQKYLDGVTVLAIDDEPDTLEYVSAVLQFRGARVLPVSNAHDAIAQIEQMRPDVVISDIGMPGLDGYGLISALRAMPSERGGSTPAIALTAYARQEDRTKLLHAGFQMHLTKPLDPAEIVSAVTTVLGRDGEDARAESPE